jgi:hypothetical protein
VLEAVLAAGFTARLADAEKDTYCVTPETIKPHLTANTSAILVVHLFGQVAPVHAIAQLAKSWGVRLVEDAAQGIGGHSESGRPIGSFGDFAFLSFDASKTIRGKGGVLLYDDDSWAEPVNRAISPDWPKEDSPSDQLCGRVCAISITVLGKRSEQSAYRQRKLLVVSARPCRFFGRYCSEDLMADQKI